MRVPASDIRSFQVAVKDYYRSQGRHDLPWRILRSDRTIDPYYVLVSEVMLQQTQASRVVPKFQEFIKLFPNIEALAGADLSEVLRAWSGLGYYRRAKFLHQTAKMIQIDFKGVFPREASELTLLPGIGKNTAAAIKVYSFNEPVVFIETNIRTVYLHHFFADVELVPDRELMPIIEASVDTASPREWYWALMDYGSYLKKTLLNPSRRSKHYSKQSTFKGSKRQVRGAVLKLLQNQDLTLQELQHSITDIRLKEVLENLAQEQLITKKSDRFSLG